MHSVVGVFKSRADAEDGAKRLRGAGVPNDAITLLTPQTPQLAGREVRVQKADGEQPGMVKALSAVAGGAAGLGLGEGLATLLIPGVGPVLAVGLVGGAVLGALAGAAVGGASEKAIFSGLPRDEFYVYKDALRQNRSVLIVLANSTDEADKEKILLEEAGAESIDRARHMWWLGLRNVEKEHYNAGGGNFERDEDDYRRGFEAALKNGHEREEREKEGIPDTWNNEAFRQGFERGRQYAAAAPQKQK